MTMYSSDVIAYAFVIKGIRENLPVTQMSLQKLTYIAHGIYLAENDTPLINEKFQAWRFGPVIPQIYHSYKLYGSSPIMDTKLILTQNFKFSNIEEEVENLPSSVQTILNKVWNAFKRTDGIRLSNWTHKKGSPWDQVYKDGVQGVEIDDDEIKKYFSSILVKSK